MGDHKATSTDRSEKGRSGVPYDNCRRVAAIKSVDNEAVISAATNLLFIRFIGRWVTIDDVRVGYKPSFQTV
jgi:hypothetical protein